MEIVKYDPIEIYLLTKSLSIDDKKAHFSYICSLFVTSAVKFL